jgi:hypothetical protein
MPFADEVRNAVTARAAPLVVGAGTAAAVIASRVGAPDDTEGAATAPGG